MVEDRMCNECGEPISAARLKEQQTTALCTRCLAAFEEDRKRRPTSGGVENPAFLSAQKEAKARAASRAAAERKRKRLEADI